MSNHVCGTAEHIEAEQKDDRHVETEVDKVTTTGARRERGVCEYLPTHLPCGKGHMISVYEVSIRGHMTPAVWKGLVGAASWCYTLGRAGCG